MFVTNWKLVLIISLLVWVLRETTYSQFTISLYSMNLLVSKIDFTISGPKFDCVIQTVFTYS